MALAPIHHLVVFEGAGSPAGVASRHAAVVACAVAISVVCNRHIGRVFYHKFVTVASAGIVENLTVVVEARYGGHGAPEAAAFRGERDVLCGVPADAFHAHGLQLFEISLGTVCNLAVLGVDVGITASAAQLVVRDGVSVAVVDVTVPAQTAVAVPPRIVIFRLVACRAVNMVRNHIDDDFYAVAFCCRAESRQVGSTAENVVCKFEIIRAIGIVPFHLRLVGTLHRRDLNSPEACFRYVGQF